MRSLLALAGLALTLVLAPGSPASAEKRIFIITGAAAGSGAERCLAKGAACERTAAAAYCRSRQFAEAVSFRRLDPDEITGGVSAKPGKSEDYVAIECQR